MQVDMQYERRHAPRLPADMPVTVTVLGSNADPLSGIALNQSGTGLLVSVGEPVGCGTPVRIEGNDMLLLGEVCRCEKSGQDYRLAVKIRHCLSGMKELDRLNRALLGDATPARELIARD